MKIDVFSHILPKKYFEALSRKGQGSVELAELAPWVARGATALSDVDILLKVLERTPGVLNVLTLATPPLEGLVSPADAVDLARIANDEMAEIVRKHPDRFIAAVACLPLNNIDASIKEADRAIAELKFRGVQIFTNIKGEPLDLPKFRPLYQRMAEHDLPIWIHPWNSPIMGSATRDLPEIVQEWVKQPFLGAIGWPFETSLAMMRLARSGVFRDYPDIKFITHHCGGMVPTFHRRIAIAQGVKIEDMHRFYGDTALYGNTAALMSGYAFFGPDHLLFGTDMPLGSGGGRGEGRTYETIRSVERMDISEEDKEKIFEENATRLLKLSF